MTDLIPAVHRGIQKSASLKDFFFDVFYRTGSQRKLDDMRNMDQLRHIMDVERSTYPKGLRTASAGSDASARYRLLHEATKRPSDALVGSRMARAVEQQVGRAPVFATSHTSEYDPGVGMPMREIHRANRINRLVGVPATRTQGSQYLPGVVRLRKQSPAAITAHELGHAVQFQKNPRMNHEYNLPAHRLAAEVDASARGLDLLRRAAGPQEAARAQSLLRSAYGTYEAGAQASYNAAKARWISDARKNTPVGAQAYRDTIRRTYPVYGFAENGTPNRLPAWPFSNYKQPGYYKDLSKTLKRHSAVQKPGLAASRAVSKGTPGTTDSF